MEEVEADLMKWCASLRPDQLDIFSDFGAKNVFLIDFDALLTELLSDKNLNWSQGGQTLHAVYLFESTLNSLLSRGGVFEIVLFREASKVIWNKQYMPANRIFMREAVLFHMRTFLSSKVPLREFDAWWSDDFIQYLKKLQPSFIMASTGFEFFSPKNGANGGMLFSGRHGMRVGSKTAFTIQVSRTCSSRSCTCTLFPKSYICYPRSSM